jgi:hypothetical protein
MLGKKIHFKKAMTKPCATDDDYCWEGQSESMQKKYLN